jgi:hypothetical protein
MVNSAIKQHKKGENIMDTRKPQQQERKPNPAPKQPQKPASPAAPNKNPSQKRG